MSRLPSIVRVASATDVSGQLLSAALAGLLCLAGCSKDDAPDTSSVAGAAGEPGDAASGGASAGAPSPGAAGSTDAGGQAAVPNEEGGASGAGGVPGSAGEAVSLAGAAGEVAAAGAGGAAPEVPHITSSENVGVMTVEQFTALCDERGGTVEVMPHCGGFATAKGFSYDATTELLSEHTCKGANTCTGWNCAITD